MERSSVANCYVRTILIYRARLLLYMMKTNPSSPAMMLECLFKDLHLSRVGSPKNAIRRAKSHSVEYPNDPSRK